MALNEADSGLPVVEGPGHGRHRRHPDSMAPALALISANEQPRSCPQDKSGLGLYPLCAGLWGSSPMFLGTA